MDPSSHHIKCKEVQDWNQLAECQSHIDNVELKIDFHYGNAWIIQDGEKRIYLSTHTFYESCYKHSTELLRNYGFNVTLKSWG